MSEAACKTSSFVTTCAVEGRDNNNPIEISVIHTRVFMCRIICLQTKQPGLGRHTHSTANSAPGPPSVGMVHAKIVKAPVSCARPAAPLLLEFGPAVIPCVGSNSE